MRNQCYYQPEPPHNPTLNYSGCMTHDNTNRLMKINYLKRLIMLHVRSNWYTEEVQLFLSLSLSVQHSHHEHIEEIFVLFGMHHQEFSYLWSFGEVSINFRVQYWSQNATGNVCVCYFPRGLVLKIKFQRLLPSDKFVGVFSDS